jgi:hypothetical protein
VDITRREDMAKMSEPSDDEAAMLGEIGEEVVTIRQPRVDGIEVECNATDKTKSSRENCVEWVVWYRVIESMVVLVFPISLSLRFAITTRQIG